MNDFYDRLAPFYHLIYPDWNGSIERQARQLVSIVEARWGRAAVNSILDVSCGVGTQALGLAQQGFQITASDLSAKAVARAREEAAKRGAAIDFSVCDMRQAYTCHRRQFDLVISGDNSITHLLSDDDILLALRQMYQCARFGGGCLLTVRDYDQEARGVGILKPYGVREEGNVRYVIFQVWDFEGDIYDLSMYFIADDKQSNQLVTQVMRSKYYAIGISRLLELMREAGFQSVERLDGVFFQPVLVGDKNA